MRCDLLRDREAGRVETDLASRSEALRNPCGVRLDRGYSEGIGFANAAA
jgi:hypothetical protein